MAKQDVTIDRMYIRFDDEKNVAMLVLCAGERRFTLESWDGEALDLRPLTIVELGPKEGEEKL